MRNEIEILARKELESANEKFSLFHSSHAVNAAMEAIQVIAMCDKFKMSL